MLEGTIIIGVVIAIMEAIKQTRFPKTLYFLPILILSALLNSGNAYFFGDGEVMIAIAEGIKLGAVASGVYSLGKATLGKS